MTFLGTYTPKANDHRGEVINLTHTPGSISKWVLVAGPGFF